MKQSSLFQLSKESLKNWLSTMNQNYRQKQAALAQQQSNIYNVQMHYELQQTFGRLLLQQSASPLLMQLHSPNDLIPCGFQIVENNSTIYYFSWIKANSARVAACVLNNLVDKFNQIINMNRTQFIMRANTLPPEYRVEYYMSNRLMYNGFHVIDCKDDVDSVILAVCID